MTSSSATFHPLVRDGELVTLGLDSTYVEHNGPPSSRQGTHGTDVHAYRAMDLVVEADAQADPQRR